MHRKKNSAVRLARAGIAFAALMIGRPNWAAADLDAGAVLRLAEARDGSGPSAPSGDPIEGEDWAVHGQFTGTEQGHPSFASPYSGPNSLDHKVQHNETTDATLFVGVKPWEGAAFWVNPEIDQGYGLSNTLGVAGFTSGEAYKVGKHRPYVRLPRVFLQQVIDLGSDTEEVKGDLNQLGGERATDRIVLTIGKFAVPDLFDNNHYAHDSKNDFLNWSIMEMGSFDYAADAWGYTYGAAAEWYQGRWTIRAGLFDLSAVPNSAALETTPFRQYQVIGELEERHQIGGRDGKLRVLWYDSEGYMGGYEQAIAYGEANPQAGVSTAHVRVFNSKQGIGLNAEQQLTDTLGGFLRAGVSQGNDEAYEFSDINQSVSGGLSLSGSLWQRADDTIGAATVVNQLSKAGLRYLAAGGLGILVGDGQLEHPGSERIGELYYKAAVSADAALTLDYQYVENPAYNRDRGPASVLAARIHAQF
jgi:high affinity Mn2+ porin